MFSPLTFTDFNLPARTHARPEVYFVARNVTTGKAAYITNTQILQFLSLLWVDSAYEIIRSTLLDIVSLHFSGRPLGFRTFKSSVYIDRIKAIMREDMENDWTGMLFSPLSPTELTFLHLAPGAVESKIREVM